MVTWQIFTGNKDDWNNMLYSIPFSSFYQSYEWGEIKRRDGWQVVRVFKKENNNISMAQILLKRLPFKIGFFWCPGGVLGTENKIEWSEILKKLGLSFYYFRSSFHNPKITAEHLKEIGYKKPKFLLNNNQSMVLDLSKTEEELLKNMSSNWRHNLKRFEKRKLTVTRWKNPDALKLFSYYEQFESMKGLARQHSLESIQGVIEFYQDSLVILEAKDEDGNLHSLRGCLIYGENALDWYAITTGLGRNTYSSYGVLWKLIEWVKKSGVIHYDLSGVDEKNNAGVFNFKKGSGGILTTYPGEYEISNAPGLRFMMNFLMSRKFKV